MKVWILLLIACVPMTLQKVICDEKGEWSCLDDWECCKNPSGGYGCCHQPKACASDGHCYRFNVFKNKKEISEPEPATNAITAAPADYAVLVKSFLKEIGFFEYIPETCECLSTLSPLAPEIIELMKKIKEIKAIEELIPILIEAYTTLYPQIKDIIKNCNDVPAELKEKINEIIAKITQPEFISKIVANVKNYFAIIVMNANQGIKMIQNGQFEEAGVAFGEIFKMIFFGI